ncbi:hypothetical protein JWG41_20100 [Leptospira sp. 201903075]|uniref:hypothetical protein n=1 Tax=Leptospira chreensis TaxID=2810035 RepID=UPI0019630E3B|nr:hypothetical protein [Leptospira chreensis]MBM9592419.1 hypothetical protein [Leptospira chreensis]MBM9592749.1 hypothetical protein [Leptospira chreensis]
MKHRFTILFYLILISLVPNCYFNPVVNGILNPIKEEKNNSFLGLLGFGSAGSDLLIVGQIRDQFGTALPELVLVPSPVSLLSKSISPYRTDTGGRFYIPYQSGRISFEVLQNESTFFTLTLNVSDPTAITSETSGGPAGLEISNLGTISASAPPSFFELVGVFAVEGQSTLVNIHKTNLGKSPTKLLLIFDEAPAYVDPEDSSWIQNSVVIAPAPSVGYGLPEVVGNQITISGAEGISSTNVTTIDFTSNIKSVSGKSLTPRGIKFCYVQSCSFY